MIFKKLQEFLTSAESRRRANHHPTSHSSPHDLHPNSPFITALVWRVNKPKVLHPASSKMFKTRTFAFATRPPLQTGKENIWETGAVSAAHFNCRSLACFLASSSKAQGSEAQISEKKQNAPTFFLVGNQLTWNFTPLTFHHHHHASGFPTWIAREPAEIQQGTARFILSDFAQSYLWKKPAMTFLEVAPVGRFWLDFFGVQTKLEKARNKMKQHNQTW